MPGAPAKLAVGGGLEPHALLKGDRPEDRIRLDCPQLGRVDRAAGELLARPQEPGGTEQAANVIGPEGRLLPAHSETLRHWPVAGPSYARPMSEWRSALRIRDPGWVSLRSAVRAAIVMPSVFAFADKVIAEAQVATFAAFGSFAMLVLVEFSGPTRSRVTAYVALAFAGAANIAIGTLCSNEPWLAAAAMGVIGFAILFAGVVNGYFAAATTAALLTFILASMIPAPASAVPERLEGWALAAAAAITAQLLIWPLRLQAPLRRDAAVAASALAELASTELERDVADVDDRAHAAERTVRDLRARFLGTLHRPSGPTDLPRPRAERGLVGLKLDWVFVLLAPPREDPGARRVRRGGTPRPRSGRWSKRLRVSAATLGGGDELPDLGRLQRTREALAQALVRDIVSARAGVGAGADSIMTTLQASFRGSRRSLGRPSRPASMRSRRRAMESWSPASLVRLERRFAHRCARSPSTPIPATCWFRNSLRSAVGLAAAVYIAQRSGVQHGFWVVLRDAVRASLECPRHRLVGRLGARRHGGGDP